MRAWWAASVIALGACDEVFDLGEVTLPPRNDAPAFMPARDCPGTYSTELTPGGSRYRIIPEIAPPRAHYMACAEDTAGLHTHLAVLETLDEQALVQARLDTSTGDIWYVGAVQPPGQATPRIGWVWLTGEPIGIGAFDPNAPTGGEPNDNDGVENNDENVAYIRDERDGLIDVFNTNQQGALCECDGRAADPAAAAAYEAGS